MIFECLGLARLGYKELWDWVLKMQEGLRRKNKGTSNEIDKIIHLFY